MSIKKDLVLNMEMQKLLESTIQNAKTVTNDDLEEFKLRVIEQIEEQIADLSDRHGASITDYVNNVHKNVIAFSANLAKLALQEEPNVRFLQIILVLVHDLQVGIIRYATQLMKDVEESKKSFQESKIESTRSQ